LSPVVLITGAPRGIGAACALLAARADYSVVVNYAATKGAIDSFTVGLAKDVPDQAHGLTHEIPMLRPRKADEVARSIVGLLGSESSYVTGALLDVTGGR
jgi:NAD(P)-dependent dehydrogenase (short-subunit alcohol dehydrogenase family)